MKSIAKLKAEFKNVRARQEIDQDEKGKSIFEDINLYCERVAIDLIKLLTDTGDIYRSAGMIYYFDGIKNQLHVVPPLPQVTNSFCQMLAMHYNFAVVDRDASKIYARLFPLMAYDATDANINIFSYYDKSQHALYIRQSETKLIRITTGEIKIHPNGFDGVIFKPSSWMKDIELKRNVNHDPEYLDSNFFFKVWFTEGENRNYTRLQQIDMFKKWMYSIFFGSLIHKRPIMVLTGATGTGKTSTLKNVGSILFGDGFAESLLPKDERDLINMLINNQFVILDNIDEKPPAWFVDTLTSITTGGMISYRPLFQDVTVPDIRVRPECFIGITSRTPEFNRADLANRAIVNTLGKASDDDYDPLDFEESLINNRSIIWTHLVKDLQQILINMQTPVTEYKQKMRMAEFANFALSSTPPTERELVQQTLDTVVDVQQQFSTFNNPMIDAIVDLVAGQPMQIHTYSSVDLLDTLNNGYGLGIKSAIALGLMLSKLEDTLSQYFTFKKTSTRDGVSYVFKRNE